jgi:hypothetical protein
MATFTLRNRIPANVFRPEPSRQDGAKACLRFVVYVLCRSNPRDVTVRTNQKDIKRGFGGGL